LRDLDTINGAAKSTRFMFTISLIIPLVMGFGAWALAIGAAPNQPLSDNFLAQFGLGVTTIAVIALPIPYIFHWNWETKYFGAAMLPLCSGSILGIYPILCIAQYSSLPAPARLAFVSFEGILIFRWCRRFVTTYNTVYCNKNLFHSLYAEEPSEVYYSQQADKKVIEKILKFEQVPHSSCFIISALIAFFATPFATQLSKFVGVPFIHIFLALLSTPLNLMFLGFATKGWLIFYLYPGKIKKITDKPIYVDISSKPPKF